MPADRPVPDLLPVLSRGKHRNPRKGACFMEFASFLAGEKWSDHPSCTHPLLASLARLVNDVTSDGARPRLAPLVPDVVGLNPQSPHVDVIIALRAAITALPVVSAERQGAMALSVLMAETVFEQLPPLEPRGAEGAQALALVASLRALGTEALSDAPAATGWAERFARRTGISARGFRRHGAPNVVRIAVGGIAEACVRSPEDLLRSLLATAIDDVQTLSAYEGAAGRDVEHSSWEAACRMTGTVVAR